MRTGLLVAFMALALQPGGSPGGAGEENASGFAPSTEVAQSRLTDGEYCGRVAIGNLSAQAAVLEDEVQLVLEGDYGTTAADF